MAPLKRRRIGTNLIPELAGHRLISTSNEEPVQKIVSVQTDSLRKTKTTNQTLPPELLLIIFEYCYEDFKLEEEGLPQLEDPPWHYVSGGLDPSSMRPSSISSLLERFRSPTRFPHALAAVSPFWQQLLTLQPEWWTEIIIYIGPNSSSSIGNAAKVLGRMRPFAASINLDFIVLRERDSKEPDSVPEAEYSPEMEERNQLSIISNLLFSSFDQCKCLTIEAKYGKSIPDIGRWHEGDSFLHDPNPSSILLTREIYDNYVGDAQLGHANSDEVHHIYEDCMKSLVINGRNLDLLYPIFVAYQRTSLVQLTIFDYRNRSNGIPIAVFLAMLEQAPNLTSLKLKKVEFIQFTGIPNPNKIFSCDILRLHLESIAPYTTALFFGWCAFRQLESIHISNSDIAPYYPPTNLLILDRLTILNHVSLKAFLADWQGSCLWLGGSSIDHDSLFDMFGKYDQVDREFISPRMDTLYLYQISVLSVKRLKKMIKSRNRMVYYKAPNWRTKTSFGPAIKKLSIDQCSIAPLTKEDVEWFSSRLVEFIYIQ